MFRIWRRVDLGKARLHSEKGGMLPGETMADIFLCNLVEYACNARYIDGMKKICGKVIETNTRPIYLMRLITVIIFAK